MLFYFPWGELCVITKAGTIWGFYRSKSHWHLFLMVEALTIICASVCQIFSMSCCVELAWNPWFQAGSPDSNDERGPVNTESQGESGWKGPQWGYRPTSLLKQGNPRANGTGLNPGTSWISPVRETPQSLWATPGKSWLCLVFGIPTYPTFQFFRWVFHQDFISTCGHVIKKKTSCTALPSRIPGIQPGKDLIEPVSSG